MTRTSAMIELKLFSKLMRFFYHNYDKMRETNFFGGGLEAPIA